MTDMAKGRTPPLQITLALAMIFLTEAIHVSVWGVLLFPAGDLAGKIVWIATCSVAMAAVIGSITTWLKLHPRRIGFFVAATTMALVGDVFYGWALNSPDAARRLRQLGGAV